MGKLAVFDLDGTLVDTAPDLAASLNHCLRSASLPELLLDVVRPHAGHGARAMLRAAYAHHGERLAPEIEDRHLALFLAYYEANIAETSRPFVGVVDAMSRLTEAGWTLAVCTNKREHLAVKLLDALGLCERFAAICGQDTFSGMKPDPAHLGGTIARANAAPETSVMVGDTITDIAAAQNVGVASVLVDFGYAPDEAARAGAGRIISHYDELTVSLADDLLAAGARR